MVKRVRGLAFRRHLSNFLSAQSRNRTCKHPGLSRTALPIGVSRRCVFGAVGKDAIAHVLPLAANVLASKSWRTIAGCFSMVSNRFAIVWDTIAFDDIATDGFNHPAVGPFLVFVLQSQHVAEFGELMWDV